MPDWLEIVSMIAHDLKTPISSVRGYVELIQHTGSLNENQEYFSGRALLAVRQMEQLVARLLEMAWIEAGRPLALEECDLTFVINEAVAALRDQADHQHVTLHVELDPELSKLQADTYALGQVVINLIGNAIKYNHPDGEVWVAAQGTPEGVEVTVRDTGVGIAAEDQARIFERFFRVQVDEGEKIEGTGLGLSIVKSLVEKHGGRIWVESAPGAGSTFGFALPRVTSLNEGHDAPHELITPPMEHAESVDNRVDDVGNEVLDAVDDNLQEPAPTIVDQDQPDVAQQE